MKFRMFTDKISGRKVAVNVENVIEVDENGDGSSTIWYDRFEGSIVNRGRVLVREDFNTALSRLNMIAE